MLQENERLVPPGNLAKIIPWDSFDAVVVLGLGKIGQESQIYMSTLTVNELCFLSQQLQAHLAYRLGPMKEGE